MPNATGGRTKGRDESARVRAHSQGQPRDRAPQPGQPRPPTFPSTMFCSEATEKLRVHWLRDKAPWAVSVGPTQQPVGLQLASSPGSPCRGALGLLRPRLQGRPGTDLWLRKHNHRRQGLT